MENSPKSQRAVGTALTGPLMAARLPGKGATIAQRAERRPQWASTGLCRHETAFPAFGVTGYRRHFWHDGWASSTCLLRTKSPHSVQDAPSGASWIGSVMWVFGFVPIMELGCLASTGSALDRAAQSQAAVCCRLVSWCRFSHPQGTIQGAALRGKENPSVPVPLDLFIPTHTASVVYLRCCACDSAM